MKNLIPNQLRCFERIDKRLAIPLVMLNGALLSSTVIFWFFAMDVQWFYLSCLLLVLLIAVFFYSFLKYKSQQKLAKISLGVWLVIFLFTSHIVLGNREGTWRGFRTDNELGWYPLSEMRERPLLTKSGDKYIVSTDARGHRNHHFYPSDGRIDIFLQGDSNAFGYGLEISETFCSQLEKIVKLHCFNVGVSGYDSQHFFYQFRQLIREFTVNTRVILFNVGNDYSLSALKTPYLIPRPSIYKSDSGNVVHDEAIYLPFKKQVYGHHFLSPFSVYDEGMVTISIGRDWGAWMPDWLANFRLGMFAFELFYPRVMNFYSIHFNEESIERGKALNPYYASWQLTNFENWPDLYRMYWPHFEILVEQISRQPAQKTVVVMFPMKDQILLTDEELTKRLLEQGYPPHASNRFDLQKMIKKVFEKNGAKVLDMTEDFLARKDPKDLYQVDFHLSAKGMALVSEKTAEFLNQS